MASISFDKHGRCRLTFAVAGEDRRAIRLGRISQKVADAVRSHVEAILTTSRYGTPIAPTTAAWLTSIDDELYERLAAAGLVASRQRPTLADFAESWIAGRQDIGDLTRRNMRYSLRLLTEYFGTAKRMDLIAEADALAFRDAMVSTFSRATVGKAIKHARQFYAAAIKADAVEVNPFTDIEAWSQENAARKRFVERSVIEALLAAEHQPRYRRLIALARYGGLRVPSEIVPLDWSDIDWDRNRFTVREAKTRTRVVPLFPELRIVLEGGRQASGPVVESGVDASRNWRSHLLKLIRRAGLTPWPRLFHNLRASRETELVREHPLHVVCEWIGNSEIVAVRHYLTVQESDFALAQKMANFVATSAPPTLIVTKSTNENAPEFAVSSESGAKNLPPRGIGLTPNAKGETGESEGAGLKVLKPHRHRAA